MFLFVFAFKREHITVYGMLSTSTDNVALLKKEIFLYEFKVSTEIFWLVVLGLAAL